MDSSGSPAAPIVKLMAIVLVLSPVLLAWVSILSNSFAVRLALSERGRTWIAERLLASVPSLSGASPLVVYVSDSPLPVAFGDGIGAFVISPSDGAVSGVISRDGYQEFASVQIRVIHTRRQWTFYRRSVRISYTTVSGRRADRSVFISRSDAEQLVRGCAQFEALHDVAGSVPGRSGICQCQGTSLDVRFY